MKVTRTYEYARINDDLGIIDVDGQIHSAEIGKHSIWIPTMEAKFPFQYNGHFVEYRDWELGQHAESIRNHTFGTEDTYSYDSLLNIVEEYIIFDSLWRKGFAPKVNGFFYIKNLISDFPYGAFHCDPKGAYGFYFQNANTIEPTEFDVDKFKKEFIESGFLTCSDAALSDILLEGRCNHINGYVVDIRRSVHDAVHLAGMDIFRERLREYAVKLCFKDELTNIKRKVQELGQFPYKERSQPYQSYWLGDKYIKGSRDVRYRFDKMLLPENMRGTTILDLGCNIGSVCQESYRRGARKIVGMDSEKAYIDCARDIARYNGHQINFVVTDLAVDPEKLVDYVNTYFKEPIGAVFALALYKHIGDNLWEILDNIRFKTLYVESSSCKDETTPHVVEVDQQLKRRYSTDFLGFTEDRSKRAIWRCVNAHNV